MIQRVHRRRFSLLAVGTTLLAGLLYAALSGGSAGVAATTNAAGSTVLTISPTARNAVVKNFNPYSQTSSLGSNGLGLDSLIYEPLLQFNLVKPKVYPWLATKYAWSNGGKTLTFTIRQNVKWSDRTPFTPADAAFTYNLVKKYSSINTGGLEIKSASAGSDTLTLTFPTPQYQRLESIASVPMLSQVVWSKVGDPSQYVDTNPVGTGPFLPDTFTPQEITLNKNPNYWQPGEPKVSAIDVPVYSSDTTLQEALQSDQVDWAGNFIPGVQKLYVSKSPYHHFWGAPLYTIDLRPNLASWPTNVLAVRQAISLAINRKALSVEAESGQDPPLLDAAGLVDPLRGYLAPSVAHITLTHNVNKAKEVLKSAGFVMGSNGFFRTKAGKELSIQITDPSAFADWVTAGSILVQDLKAAGINATFVGQSVSGFVANLASGNFQLAQWFGTLNPGINPYSVYNDLFSSALTAPIGKKATSNYERLRSPLVDKALHTFAQAATKVAAIKALTPIEKYAATQLPVIPTVQEVAFDQYNDKNFTGWPSASNPYEEGNPSNITNEVVILHLTPRS